MLQMIKTAIDHRTMNRMWIIGITASVLLFATWTHARGQDVLENLSALSVEKEDWCSKYDRSDYPYPRSIESVIIRIQGGIFSPYDLMCFSSPRQSDVEHIVALAEAHRSGMCAREHQEKEQFASDLLNLTLATPELNREQKMDKDAADWMPPENQCWYAARIVAVKKKYGLSVDKAEKRALQQILKHCYSTSMDTPFCNQ